MESRDGFYPPEKNDYENVYSQEQADIIDNNDPPKNGILDLVYGVLFDPAKTFAGFAEASPVGMAVVIFAAVNLLEALVGFFTTPMYLHDLHIPGLDSGFAYVMAPLVSFGGLALSVIMWFVMAGLLHLLADLYGGKGNARGVFAVCGVVGLPALFMIPVQVVLLFVSSSFAQNTISGLLSFVLFIWSVALLVIGLRAVHRLSTGMALLTVITPVAALVILAVLVFIITGTALSQSVLGEMVRF